MSAPEPPKISSALPLPPPFYHAFTHTNTTRIAALRKAHRHLATPATAVAYAQSRDKDLAALVPRVPNAAPQYEFLQPPPEPADGRWRFNGDHFSLDDRIPSLEEQNIRRLIPGGTDGSGEGGGEAGAGREVKHLDRAFQLKKLAKSQLLNFLELTGILSQTPQDASQKLDDIHTIFINMHHIINEYRPHQARESAIAMLQDRLDRTRAETANIRSKTEMARQALEGLRSIDMPPQFASKFAAAFKECAEGKDTNGMENAEKNVPEVTTVAMTTWALLDDL